MFKKIVSLIVVTFIVLSVLTSCNSELDMDVEESTSQEESAYEQIETTEGTIETSDTTVSDVIEPTSNVKAMSIDELEAFCESKGWSCNGKTETRINARILIPNGYGASEGEIEFHLCESVYDAKSVFQRYAEMFSDQNSSIIESKENFIFLVVSHDRDVDYVIISCVQNTVLWYAHSTDNINIAIDNVKAMNYYQ